MKRFLLLIFSLLIGPAYRAAAQTPAPFAKGADVSWVTQMEQSNYRFYNEAGTAQDLFQLLHDHDMNAIRLRVWVNPTGGWNGVNDVVAKAVRAKNLGFRVMIDFHYSDSFADPGKQTKPAAWQNYSFAQLLTAVYDHTTAVMDSLKKHNVTPEWVQVGNEVNGGMLWPDGAISTTNTNFTQLVNQGYAAVKLVSPTSKVIVHISNGFDNARFRRVFDKLTTEGGKFDVIGMSLYPSDTNWPSYTALCLSNMNDMVTRYPGKEVMVVETGMPASAVIPTQQMLLDLIAKVKSVPANKGLGVLCWEPQAYNWMGYGLGLWKSNGQPTAAISSFLNSPPAPGLVYNPGFEYTGATQNPLGWSTASVTSGDYDADLTQAYGRASSYQLGHQKATAYQVRTYQFLNNVPNGTYTLRAWAQSSGGQTTCQLYANSFGGNELAATLPTTSTWTPVQVTGIVVTNGQCEIGLRSNALGGQTASLDDVEFVATALTATTTGADQPGFTADVYPNPSSGPRTLSLTLIHDEKVQLSILSLTGQLVRTIAEPRALTAGKQVISFKTNNLGTGTYLLKITHGETVAVRKLVQL